jgi:hypothetical protein
LRLKRLVSSNSGLPPAQRRQAQTGDQGYGHRGPSGEDEFVAAKRFLKLVCRLRS